MNLAPADVRAVAAGDGDGAVGLGDRREPRLLERGPQALTAEGQDPCARSVLLGEQVRRAWAEVTTSDGSARTPTPASFSATCAGVREALLVTNATCTSAARTASIRSATPSIASLPT